MLEVLHSVEHLLPVLLRKEEWQSLLIDYHPPTVERLWRDWNGYRIYLHCIHPCLPEEALFHPHPWPSAVRVVSGSYEMGVGSGEGEAPPPVVTRLILHEVDEYEMTDPLGWHYVRPLGGSSMALMVTGKPWVRWSPTSDKPLSPLPFMKARQLLEFFQGAYQ